MTFEGEGLLPHEVGTSIKITLSKIENSLREENGISALDYFEIIETRKGKGSIKKDYPKAGHEKRKVENRKFTPVTVEDLSYSKGWFSVAKSNVRKVTRNLKDLLVERFKSFEEPVFKNMQFFDPKFWNDDDSHHGDDQIKFLFEHFKEPLNIISLIF